MSTHENRYKVRIGATHTRLLSLLCAFTALLASPLARAQAPMCNDDATSVAAPLIVLPTDNGTLSASPPCHHGSEPGLSLGKAPAPEQGSSGVSAEPLRALPFGSVWPPLRRSAPLPIAKRRALPAHPGFQSSVYRPPRA